MRSPVRGTTLPPASFFINRRGRPLPHAVRSCGPAYLGGHIPSRPSKTTKPPTWRGRHIGGAGQHGSTPWFHSLGISARPDNGGQPSGDTAAGVSRRFPPAAGGNSRRGRISPVFREKRSQPPAFSLCHGTLRLLPPGCMFLIARKTGPRFHYNPLSEKVHTYFSPRLPSAKYRRPAHTYWNPDTRVSATDTQMRI